MAKKRKAEGIALLSVYNDEEEEEQEEEEEEEDADEGHLQADDEAQEEEEQRLPTVSPASSSSSPALSSPLAPLPESGASPLGNPPTSADVAGSLRLGIVDYAHEDAMVFDSVAALGIVDYAHDDVVVSVSVAASGIVDYQEDAMVSGNVTALEMVDYAQEDAMVSASVAAVGMVDYDQDEAMVSVVGTVSLGIVDYGQDDAMMSPEPEEGEITVTNTSVIMSETTIEPIGQMEVPQLDSNVSITAGKDLPSERDGWLEESTLKDAAELNNEKSSEPILEVNSNIQSEAVQTDPLLEFLPSAPSRTCSAELQMKFTKYFQMKSQGKSFNKELRGSKGYRNPDFLQRAVRYQGIDQIGSCFRKDIFDPHGYDAADFYDALVAQQRREMEKKEQEKKQSQRVDFVRAGVQVSQVASVDARTKSTMQIVAPQKSGLSNNVANALQAVTSSSNGSEKADVRVVKKSKWDKVETVGKALPGVPTGGPHTIAAASAHVALMSAAGAGYASFAQQKRKEAEGKLKSAEKISGFSAKPEKKFDKS